MNTTNFLKQIRSIIREEIEYALDKKLNENTKKDDRKVLSHGMNLMKEVGANKIKNKKPQSSKSGLTSIQSLLDETRRSMEESMALDDGYDNELRFTTDSLNAFSSPRVNAAPSGINVNELPQEVSNALTRDYSALMKKIQEKTGR